MRVVDITKVDPTTFRVAIELSDGTHEAVCTFHENVLRDGSTAEGFTLEPEIIHDKIMRGEIDSRELGRVINEFRKRSL